MKGESRKMCVNLIARKPRLSQNNADIIQIILNTTFTPQPVGKVCV
jgi:hypothetical protein